MYFCGAVWFRLDIARGNPAKVNHWCMQFILTANDTILGATIPHNTARKATTPHDTAREATTPHDTAGEATILHDTRPNGSGRACDSFRATHLPVSEQRETIKYENMTEPEKSGK